MNTLRLCTSLTTTVAFGSAMNFAAACTNCARSCSGVDPATLMSFSSGKEILPPGRTTTSADMSLSRQKTIDSTSSGPMTYPGGSVAVVDVAADAPLAEGCGAGDV